MNATAPQLVPGAKASTPARPGSSDREYQELWFALARREWNSLVLVPADEGASAAGIATTLAEAGRRLRNVPVSFFVVVDSLDSSSAAKIAARLGRAARGAEPRTVAPGGHLLVAIQPVVEEPLGIAVAQAADAVVLCIEIGRTRLSAARRTIELIGRDRITAALVIS